MPAPPLGLAPVTVDPGSDTGLYYILVGNLDSNTTWHELKAFVRKRCEVDSAEIYLRGTDPKRAYGWVRVRGKKRFDIALAHLGGAEFKGRTIIASGKNESQSIPVLMSLGAFKPTSHDPYFPGTGPPREEYEVFRSADDEEHWRWYYAYDPSGSYTAGPSNHAPYGYSSESQYYVIEDEPETSRGKDSGPTRFLRVTELPGRKQAKTAIRELILKNISVASDDIEEFRFQTKVDGELDNMVLVTFRTVEAAQTAWGELNGKQLEHRNKRRNVRVKFIRDKAVASVESSGELSRGKEKGKEAPPVIVDGSYKAKGKASVNAYDSRKPPSKDKGKGRAVASPVEYGEGQSKQVSSQKGGSSNIPTAPASMRKAAETKESERSGRGRGRGSGSGKGGHR